MSPERSFPNDAASVPSARRYVLDVVAGVAPPVADAIALMTSELAANAVRHTPSQFTVTVDLTTSEVRVTVTDRGPGAPIVRAPEKDDPSGRGLQIVEALADDWGVVPALAQGSTEQGKTVWFTIALEPSPDKGPSAAREVAHSPAPADAERHDASQRPSTPNAGTGFSAHERRGARAWSRSRPFVKRSGTPRFGRGPATGTPPRERLRRSRCS